MIKKNLALGVIASLDLAGSAYAATGSTTQTQTAEPESVLVSGAVTTGIGALSNNTRRHSTTHVEVVTAKELMATGQTNVIAALAQMAPAINSPPAGGIGSNNVARLMILRNLGPDETLVLVNGKRRHLGANFNFNTGPATGSQPTDISLIPISAIDHVEVIMDGATALYGQEAIGGAVNIVLKSTPGKGSINLQDSGYYAGDGVGIDGYGDYTFALGHHGGFLDLATQITHQQPTNRSGLNTSQKYFSLPDGSLDPREQKIGNDVNRIQGISRSLSELFSANGSLPLTDKISLYTTATYSHRDVDAPGFFRTANNDANVRAIFPNGFSPHLTTEENDFQVNGGIRGRDFHGWNWDAYVLYGRDQLRYGAYDTISPTYGLNSQTKFYNGTNIASDLTAGFKMSRDIPSAILAKPLGVELGGEYRHDTFQMAQGDTQSWGNGGVAILDGPNAGKAAAPGASAYSGTPPSAAGNHYRDIFDGHVNLDLWATKKWEWTLGGHATNYSDTITAFTGSIGTRYNFNKRWAIRANINTGYRPPTLAGLYYSTVFSTPGYQSAYASSTSQIARLLGAEGRKGEYSRSYSVGIDATPVDNFHITANLYRIGINDRLESTSNFGGASIEGLLQSAGISGVRYVQYYTNPVDTVTNGGDVNATYLLNLPQGHSLQFGVNVNIADTQISRYRKTPEILAAYGQDYYNKFSQNDLLHTSPKNRETLSLVWHKGRYTLSIQEQRYGSVTFIVSPSQPSSTWTKVRPQWNTDVNLDVGITERAHVSVGANNLFNKYPTQVSRAAAAPTGSYRYATYSPSGFMGGYYYVRGSFNF
ncbi:TonB-dependent outer membrane receptor [Acetobacter malorum]|uniref:TonB-dependent outer membrane receptor n=1 Tax=Acetobacter malorum TaxID=178901 RepID=A0A087PN50_9PROT|nr:TonB-dependent receptor [Acetobacter malorum]KFL88803.1 TonB-dependent outer membrane receptor [Acetobacter malorum]OAG76969.1 TonB-dependent outer membrane receptor [Acetobacter malorum]